jgi:hypothetical protein
MKINTLTITIIFALTIFSNILAANNNQELNQTNVTYSTLDTSKLDKMKIGAFGEIGGQARGAESAPDYIRRPQAFPKGFSGYKIELFTVYNNELSLNDELFKTFGGIMIERRSDNSFTYLLGEFADKDAVQDYLNKVIKSRYADAKAVKYKNGEVVKFK